jgi:hypothetical protein
LLDLGLPTIRQWLRDRVGLAADVAHVTTDGSFVHLDGVRIPIGPRGLLVLDRASAAITAPSRRGSRSALGRAGLPELRLHAFTGVLGFGDSTHGFRADVSFAASPEPEEAAWIWGELAIKSASWAAREESPTSKPMNGHARLFVSSREWRLDGGRLDGELFRGHFAGSGTFEGAEGVGERGESTEPEAPLVPPALSVVALSLAHGRVGPFLDALSGLTGKEIAVPSFIPLDAELDGDLSWSLDEGGRAELRVASESIRATVRGAIGRTGKELTGLLDAHVRPALLLRRSGIPPEALPRDDDTVRVELDVGGELRHLTVKGTLRAPEIGFRLGRARFVPAVTLHSLESEVFLKDDRAVLHAVAGARAGKVTLDVDAHLFEGFRASSFPHSRAPLGALVRKPASVRGTLRADALEAAFLRDVLRTLGAKLTLPDDLVGTVDVALAPADAGSRHVVSGTATLSTASSKLVLDVPAEGRTRITGGVTARDLVATGLFNGAVVPVEGDVVVALDLVTAAGGIGLRGTAASSRLALGIRDRPELPPYVFEEATANVAIEAGALTHDELRFRAHGGRFAGKGTIPFARDPASVLLDLELQEGGAEVVEALARIAKADRVHVRIAGDGARPADERWVPRALTGHGRLTLHGDGGLRADLTLATPAGTALELGLRLARGHLDGSTMVGDLAAADAMASGFLGSGNDASGVARIDALVVGKEGGPAVLLSIRSEELVVTRAGAPFVFTNVAAALRIDADGVMWNRIETDLYGGAVKSSGVYAPGGRQQVRVSFSQVAVHRLPALAGREPSTLVRGLLSGSVIGRLDGTLRVAGDVMLDEAAFPALDLVRPMLARYGLRPPNEDASRAATAVIAGTDGGISFRDVKVDLRGATVRGELGIARTRMLDGYAEVVLEEEYLRTSKLLTLPRVLTDRIVLPVRIEGSLDRPHVHASLGESLGRFLKDNRVSAFVTSAVEEAQLLFGRQPLSQFEHERAKERPPHEVELDAELRAVLDAHHADWEILRRRDAERAG